MELFYNLANYANMVFGLPKLNKHDTNKEIKIELTSVTTEEDYGANGKQLFSV